mmetsp:Transcript_129329/g.251811  ORF Transcript_129329/g.251811 Transcript_129329/m.251811 type:complete len:210 (+) Transcript_129329:190-819(+)
MRLAHQRGHLAPMGRRNIAMTGRLAAVFVERLVDSCTWVRVWAWRLARTEIETVTEVDTGIEIGVIEEGATGMSETGTVFASAAEAAVEGEAAVPTATVGAAASVVVATGTAVVMAGGAAAIEPQALRATTLMSMTTRSTANMRSTASRGHLPVRATGRARKNVANEGDDCSEPVENRLLVTCCPEMAVTRKAMMAATTTRRVAVALQW